MDRPQPGLSVAARPQHCHHLRHRLSPDGKVLDTQFNPHREVSNFLARLWFFALAKRCSTSVRIKSPTASGWFPRPAIKPVGLPNADAAEVVDPCTAIGQDHPSVRIASRSPCHASLPRKHRMPQPKHRAQTRLDGLALRLQGCRSPYWCARCALQSSDVHTATRAETAIDSSNSTFIELSLSPDRCRTAAYAAARGISRSARRQGRTKSSRKCRSRRRSSWSGCRCSRRYRRSSAHAKAIWTMRQRRSSKRCGPTRPPSSAPDRKPACPSDAPARVMEAGPATGRR